MHGAFLLSGFAVPHMQPCPIHTSVSHFLLPDSESPRGARLRSPCDSLSLSSPVRSLRILLNYLTTIALFRPRLAIKPGSPEPNLGIVSLFVVCKIDLSDSRFGNVTVGIEIDEGLSLSGYWYSVLREFASFVL